MCVFTFLLPAQGCFLTTVTTGMDYLINSESKHLLCGQVPGTEVGAAGTDIQQEFIEPAWGARDGSSQEGCRNAD